MKFRVLASAVSLAALIAITWSLLDREAPALPPTEDASVRNERKSSLPKASPAGVDMTTAPAVPAIGSRVYRSTDEVFKKLESVKLADLEDWLKSTGRSAESLVAAWELTRDPSLEAELAEKHADNPLVCLAMLGRELGQIDQVWVERLRKAAPEHPLPDCLDATAAAKAGDLATAKAAVARALEHKGRRDSYQAERMTALREAAAAAGLDPHTAAFAPVKALSATATYVVAGGASSLLKHVRTGTITADQSGDAAATAISIAHHLAPGASSSVLNDLVIASVHIHALKYLPADTELGDSGRTLGEAAADGEKVRAFMKNSDKVSGALNYATTAEVNAYYDRWMLQGERAAHEWALERIAAAEAEQAR